MALWTDRTKPEIADLERYESGLLEVASIEKIGLSEKLEAARDEVGTELETFLQRESQRSAYQRVVVTEALHRWTALHCLSLFFQDAQLNQVSDRYRAKSEMYARRSLEAKRQLFTNGVGIVANPLRRPTPPQLSQTTGTQAAGTYFFRISWSAGTAESEASEVRAITTTVPSAIVVAPSGVPDGVTRWNVYGGSEEGAVSRQNRTELTIPGVWTLPAGGFIVGDPVPDGQLPDSWIQKSNVIPRG